MSEAQRIELSEEASRIVRDCKDSASWMTRAIALSMREQNQYTVANIQAKHLTGKGPFPVSEHKLGVRTNLLRSSVWASDPVTSSTGSAESAIGSNVVYAAVHEFGARIQHKARAGSVRLRTNKNGELMRQAGSAYLAIFAKASHKRAKTVAYQAAAHEVVIPARAPFATGFEERFDKIGDAISQAIVDAWKAQGNKS